MEQTPNSTTQDIGLAEEAKLPARRWVMLALNLVSIAALAGLMTTVLGGAGRNWATILFLTLYIIGLPWTLLGFWNAAVGFVILRLVKDPVGYTNPALRVTPAAGPITTRTAICLAVRHEDVAASFGRLSAMIASLETTGWAKMFDFHVLSDTARADIAAAEEAAFAALKAQSARPASLFYRRRSTNEGFKAGNLREFALRAKGVYEHVIVLDADSMMSGAAMVRLVRAMQANPRLGILQTLVVGRPSASGFTRIFQFGMRQGMRVQTTGSAWWQGSSGPFWGHNAILRTAPFVDHCDLPILPGRPPLGGAVLSHDQVEAAMMRGSGWDVRVIPDEFESWEENPPNLPDFIKRDLRWCQGNLQYLKLLTMPGLRPMGRFQLVNAIMMYVGAPMSFLMLAAGVGIAFSPNPPQFATNLAFGLYLSMMALGFAPRFLGVADILLSPGGARRYGGLARLLAGCLLDLVFSLMLGPIMMVAQTVFVTGLAFGRRVLWDAQNRADRTVGALEALKGLTPQTLLGLAGVAAVLATRPEALPWASPTLLPCLLAVPFTCFSAGPTFSAAMTRLKLCAIPDEFAPALELQAGDFVAIAAPASA